MANKSVLIGGRTVNVKGRSSFDKSFLNALTSGVGTITPIMSKLVIPSFGRVQLSAHAELPPLATDAYLRSHLKIEAFYTPVRLLTGSLQSWISGEQVYDHTSGTFARANLPCAFVCGRVNDQDLGELPADPSGISAVFGASSLTDYFNVRFEKDADTESYIIPEFAEELCQTEKGTCYGLNLNVLPYVNYHLLYHHYYRNKSVQRPVFAPTDVATNGDSSILHAYNLPFVSTIIKPQIVLGSSAVGSEGLTFDNHGYSVDQLIDSDSVRSCSDKLLDGHALWQLRQRNYGDDYFTAARPQAQAGSPVTVQVDSSGKFSIASLRLQNALQEFEEVNNYATPDYVQTMLARYGVNVSAGVVQKPVVLASADFPMFSKSVELNANGVSSDSRNPFVRSGQIGAVGGRASANGIDFTFDFDAKEPGYVMVLATLVPEANYASGIDHSMRIFIDSGDLTDLPCSLLEHVGDEPIMASELYAGAGNQDVFGYVQRYLWHKAGSGNQVHGLYRRGESLEAFVPQRDFSSSPRISSAMLEVPKDALDDVASVSAGISQYGVQLDCAFKVSISEPLSESALPALSDPAREHGREVYLSNGGSTL